jgi:hypothetical protein
MREKGSGFSTSALRDSGWSARTRAEELIPLYRANVRKTLKPLVRLYNPAMLGGAQEEYRKMLELSTKMSVVEHACTEIAGHEYNERRQAFAGGTVQG